MKEIWKDIEGFEDLYQISNNGRVKSLKRKILYKDGRSFIKEESILNPSIGNKGYYYLNLRKNGISYNKRIHRLVLMHFKPQLKNKTQTNHIDGNKSNNNINNLEWVTNSENQIHAVKLGIRGTKLDIDKARFIRRNKKYTTRKLANMFNVDISLIRLVLNNKIWNHDECY